MSGASSCIGNGDGDGDASDGDTADPDLSMEVMNNDDHPVGGSATAMDEEDPPIDDSSDDCVLLPRGGDNAEESLGDAMATTGETPADALPTEGPQLTMAEGVPPAMAEGVPPAMAEVDDRTSAELTRQQLFASKYITKRGSIWHASIPTPTSATAAAAVKSRFLGIFDDEAAAHRACMAAISDTSHSSRYEHRLPSSAVKSSLGSRSKAASSSSEGSCTSEQYYLDLSEDDLVGEISAMARVRSILGHPLRAWTPCSAQQQPPCFGRLCFSDGAHIDVTTLACLMGKADASCSHLMAALGDCQGGSAAGLHFRCAADPWSGGGLSDDDDQMMTMIPAMHIDSHPSIAKCHAYLRWNFKLGDFQVLALSAVGIYLNGLKILPEHGPQTLQSRSILQMGCRIMYFVRPRKHSTECTQRPVEQRQALLSSVAELVGLRQAMHPSTGQEEQQRHSQVDLLRTHSGGGELGETMRGGPVNWDPAPTSSSGHELVASSQSSGEEGAAAQALPVDHHLRLDGIALLLEASAKRADARS